MKTQLAQLLWDYVVSVMHFEVLKRTQLRKYKDNMKHKPCTEKDAPEFAPQSACTALELV